MVRCGCASDQCSCVIVAGDNVTITGGGTSNNPYVVEAATVVVDESGDPIPDPPAFPSGTITMYGGATAPTDWLLCNGAAINRTTYADLFAILGTSYGAGNGTTTFNLPNLNDRFPIGVSGTYARGATGGALTKTIITANLPAHTHAIDHNHSAFDTASGGTHSHTQPTTSADTGSSTTRVARGSGVSSGDVTYISGDGAHTHSIDVPAFTGTSGSAGSGTPLDTTPPYVAVNYIIKT